MKIWRTLIVSFCIIIVSIFYSFSYENCIVIDLINRNVDFHNVKIGNLIVNFHSDIVGIQEDVSSSIYKIAIKRMFINSYYLGDIDSRITVEGGYISLVNLKNENFLVRWRMSKEDNLSIDGNIHIYKLDLSGIGRNFLINGLTEGEITLKGTLLVPFIRASFTIKDGSLGIRRFSYANVYLEGALPFIKLYESKFFLEDGNVITLDGFIELSKVINYFINTPNIEKMNVGGWDILSPYRDKDKLTLSKNGASISFNPLSSGQSSYESEGEYTQFLYQIDKDTFFKVGFKEKDSILGIEKRLEF